MQINLTLKAIVLAGGYGTRLYPLTRAISKQLIPVYDNPMIHYPLHMLRIFGIDPEHTAIIVTPQSLPDFQHVLGDAYHYIEQPEPEGIAQAPLLAEKWLAGDEFVLVLGDNLFTAPSSIEHCLRRRDINRCTIFLTRVSNPQRYGCMQYTGKVGVKFIEKPIEPGDYWVVTGVYYFPADAVSRALALKKSARGEYEIIDLISSYGDSIIAEHLYEGCYWLDMGTPDDLLEAANLVRCLRKRHGSKLGIL